MVAWQKSVSFFLGGGAGGTRLAFTRCQAIGFLQEGEFLVMEADYARRTRALQEKVEGRKDHKICGDAKKKLATWRGAQF